jgi:serralysin
VVSGESAALEALEPIFHQDLNGDGQIGANPVIEADGATSLVQVGSNYFFDPVGGTSGPELKDGGNPFTVGEIAGWTPIGVEQVGSGYDVAWKVIGADEYCGWITDSQGNHTGTLLGVVSGESAALEALEPIFHQDLNGDGVIDPQPDMTVAAGAGASTSGLLTVSDGTHTANINLLGNYLSSTFVPSSAGQAGTNIVAPAAILAATQVLTQPHV